MKKTSGLVKIILAFALIIGAFSFNSSFAAGQDVEINETNFPSEGFRDYVKKFDTNKNDTLEESEIKAVKKIDLSEKENEASSLKDFKTLKGIEYFTELESLKSQAASLKNIDVSKNTKLKYLDVSYNKLDGLDVSKNHELIELKFINDGLKELNISNNLKLKKLDMSKNEVPELDVSKQKDLEELLCFHNQLTTLDLTNNLKLKSLIAYSNKLTSINVEKNKALENLDLGVNKLTELNLKNNTSLKYLDVSINKLTKLDLTNNNLLTSLDCSLNKLDELNVVNLTELEELICATNKIETLDLSRNTKLQKLECSNNKIKELDLSNKKDLTHLNCGINKIKELDVTNNPDLKNISFSSNQIDKIDLSNKAKLENVYCDENKLTSLDMKNSPNVEVLKGEGQTYDILVNKKDMSYDLSKLPGKFDTSKVQNLRGAKIVGAKLIIDKDITSVYYDYFAGKSKLFDQDNKINVTLQIKYNDKEPEVTPEIPSNPEGVAPSTPEIKNTIIKRLAGSDRIATAIEVSKKEYPSASTVIIARSDIYPDSLAAASISHKLRAPILLTESNKLDDRVKTEIKRLKATNVIIVGGEKSITKDVHDALLEYDKDKNIERIAGNNRYETSAALAKKLVEDLKEAKHAAVIASGENFADALTAGAYAAGEYYPILLVQKDEIDPSIAKVIKSYEINKTIIAGGKMSVSEKVEQELPKDTQRIAGADRYETSAKIADQLFKTQLAYVASGEVFADALVTSPVAASHKTPILLVSKDKASKEVKDYVKKTIDYLIIVGGEKSVPNSVVLELEKASK